jgi:hypothetical protein
MIGKTAAELLRGACEVARWTTPVIVIKVVAPMLNNILIQVTLTKYLRLIVLHWSPIGLTAQNLNGNLANWSQLLALHTVA